MVVVIINSSILGFYLSVLVPGRKDHFLRPFYTTSLGHELDYTLKSLSKLKTLLTLGFYPWRFSSN